ncbi:NAD(P)-binding domain-containing protein [Micromonospora lupini]|uniref:NAD(P)-binding domain-containing protein n=1 Tax=Micromonospora lupini TaxID=285679 RepID=UPI0033F53D90
MARTAWVAIRQSRTTAHCWTAATAATSCSRPTASFARANSSTCPVRQSVDVVDAPVSDGRAVAFARQLTTIVGGDVAIVERLTPLFLTFFGTVMPVGADRSKHDRYRPGAIAHDRVRSTPTAPTSELRAAGSLR